MKCYLFLLVSVFIAKTLNEGEGLVAMQSSQGYQDGIHDLIFITSGHRKKKLHAIAKNTLMLHFKRDFKNTEVSETQKIFKVMAPTACIMCYKEYSILLYSFFYVLIYMCNLA